MKITDTKMLGASIKEKRKQMKLTQEALSRITGMSTSFISNLENGKETAEIGKVIQLLQMLGMDLSVSERGGRI